MTNNFKYTPLGLPPKKDDPILGGNKVNVTSVKPPRGDEDTQKTHLVDDDKTVRNTLAEVLNTGNVRLLEVTNSIFQQLKKGQICRYGTTGWILRCPQCGKLIIMEDDTHKTYVNRDQTHYRLTPSLVCPHQDCTWHVFAVVVPEDVDATTEVIDVTDRKEEDPSTLVT